MNDVEKKLKRLKNEDIIWIIYFFIVVFALYSNKLDRDYLLKKDKEAYKREKSINITIFFVAFFIYLYFLLLLTEDILLQTWTAVPKALPAFPVLSGYH